jgi:uncharacterized membrane protein
MSVMNRPSTTSRTGRRLTGAFLIAAVCGTNILILKGSYLPWIGPAAGFLFALGLPAWMLSQKINWRTDQPSERLAYSVVSAVLALMLIGLAMNTALPYLGINRPLDRIPVVIGINIWCAALLLWRPKQFKPDVPRFRLDRLKGIDRAVGALSAFCVPMAVIGANRLNNGVGGGVTLAMLVLASFVFTLTLVKSEQLNPGTITAAIYFVSLAMLLMTSLRGWYTTGHDIQQEYMVFELTKSHGHWNIGSYRDAYNACLSITILPTMLWQVVRVNDPYVYKFFFQLLFALCPVFVYRISVRYTTKMLAIVATIFFVAFPTYFTDMPFLNRQEIAFLFVAACVMTASDPTVSQHKVRVRIGIFSLGVVLSHYSTSYVFLGTLIFGWVSYHAWILLRKIRQKERQAPRTRREANRLSVSPAISLLNVILVFTGIVLWNGAATHTISGLNATFAQAIASLRGGTSADSKSSDVSYSLFSTGTPPESEQLAQYTKSTLAQTATERVAGVYLQQKIIEKYPIELASGSNLPVTAVGRWVDDLGLNVSTLNSIVRAGAAKLWQLFVALGLLVAILSRKNRSRSFVELTALACSAFVIVALQVVLPVISVNYGVLRAFLQALIVFGPMVAIGSAVIFKPFGEKWACRASAAIAVIFFLSLTGVLPQITGGYPAQLNLNNSGQYHNIYYTHPQDITAIKWLQAHIPKDSVGQAESALQTDTYTFSQLQTFTDLYPSSDIYPTLLQKNSYVFLGYTTVRERQATISVEGNLITYQYPIGLLDSTKDLIYSSNGAKIYR